MKNSMLNLLGCFCKNIGILYHLLHVGCSAKDVGAKTQFFVSIQSKRETNNAIVIGALNILFRSKINIKNFGDWTTSKS
jgi:hypothetical protein